MKTLMRLSEVSGSCVPVYTLKCFVSNFHHSFILLIVPLGLLFALEGDPLLGTNLSFNIHYVQETISMGKKYILKGDGSWISNLQMEHEKGSGKK